MRRIRRAVVVLAVAIGVWLAATVGVLVWILSEILPDPASHRAADATLALIVLTPMFVTTLVGLAVLVRLRRPLTRGSAMLGLAWAAASSVIGVAGASRLLGLTWRAVTGELRMTWDAAEGGFAFISAGGADFTHASDLVALGLAIVALLGALAAARLLAAPSPRL